MHACPHPCTKPSCSISTLVFISWKTCLKVDNVLKVYSNSDVYISVCVLTCTLDFERYVIRWKIFKLQISLKRTLITIFRRELIWFYVMPSSICHLQFTLIILKTCKISKKKKCSIFRIYMAFIIKKDNAPWILLYWFKVLQSRQYFDDLHLMLHKKIKYVPLHLGLWC